MKIPPFALLAVLSLGVAAGCGSSKCAVDCAPGFTPAPAACTCLPLDAGTLGSAGAGGASGGSVGTGGAAGGQGGAAGGGAGT
jgi:hypothetical protein